jgi:hypothetical protein
MDERAILSYSRTFQFWTFLSSTPFLVQHYHTNIFQTYIGQEPNVRRGKVTQSQTGPWENKTPFTQPTDQILYMTPQTLALGRKNLVSWVWNDEKIWASTMQCVDVLVFISSSPTQNRISEEYPTPSTPCWNKWNTQRKIIMPMSLYYTRILSSVMWWEWRVLVQMIGFIGTFVTTSLNHT